MHIAQSLTQTLKKTLIWKQKDTNQQVMVRISTNSLPV